MSLLELEDVHVVHRIRARRIFGHDNVYALTDAHLSLDPGETIGVVGESGCGKSTLATLTLGLPGHVTAATGIDAMVHAVEAYTSARLKNPLSDALAREAFGC